MCLCLNSSSIGKKFRTRGGQTVTVLRLTARLAYPIRGRDNVGCEADYQTDGRYYSACESSRDLIAEIVECCPTICLTNSDIGKKFKNRRGTIIVLESSAGKSAYHDTHPYWAVELGGTFGQSVTSQGIERASRTAGSIYDLVERVESPTPQHKSWDSLRKQDCSQGKIQPGQWKTDAGSVITLDHINNGSIAVDIPKVGMYPRNIRKVGEFLIACADQAEGKA